MSHDPRPRVLVTGGSIAGPALAWALHREGYAPTVLERAPGPRAAGQNIDIRGLGHEVLNRMGLQDAVRANLTGELGARFLDRTGRIHAENPATPGRDGPTAELEILRGTLSEILVAAIADDVDLRYGDYVTAVDQDAAGVDVEFRSGHHERFDLLVVAEGRSSRTRRLLFAEQTRYLDKGLNVAYGTIDRHPDDTDWWTWFNTTEGRAVAVRPDNVGTLRAHLSFPSPDIGFDTLPVDAQLQVLRQRFRDVGWQTERIIDGFAACPDEFYAERMAQVVVSRWSQGRVVLLGDAAWGSGPTGMGTTLSLVGSHILAGELGRIRRDPHARPEQAFERYERTIRGYVDSAQGLPPGMPRLSHPNTAAGVRVLRLMQRVIATKPVRGLVQKTLVTNQRHEPRLAEYPRLRG